jgi:alpha-tubulin suppressor-like RCC1 family protein
MMPALPYNPLAIKTVAGNTLMICVLQEHTGQIHCRGSSIFGNKGLSPFSPRSNDDVFVVPIPMATELYGGGSGGGTAFAARLVNGSFVYWGQFAFGPEDVFAVSPLVYPGKQVLDVAMNDLVLCVVFTDGTAGCLGYNYEGLSFGSETFPIAYTSELVLTTGVNNADSIRCTQLTMCVHLVTGLIQCWGSSNFGARGMGTLLDNPLPSLVHNITDSVALFAGLSHFCVLHIPVSVSCWGSNVYGESGVGNVSANLLEPQHSFVWDGYPIVTLSLQHFKTCALLSNETALCIGVDDYTSIYFPETDATLVGLSSITTYVTSYVCGVNKYQNAFCIIKEPQMFLYGNYTQFVAELLPKYRSLCMSDDTSCAIVEEGESKTTQCYSSLAHADISNTPYQWTTVSTTGELFCGAAQFVSWNQSTAHFFRGTVNDIVQPAESTIRMVTMESSRYFFLYANGTTYVHLVGVPGYTFVGHNKTYIYSIKHSTCVLSYTNALECDGLDPIWVNSVPVFASEVVKMSATADHACALLATQTITCWGHDSYGQLGNGANRPDLFLDVVVYKSATCAIDGNKEVWCVGEAGPGVYTGTTIVSPSWLRIANLRQVDSLQASDDTICAYVADSVWCFGEADNVPNQNNIKPFLLTPEVLLATNGPSNAPTSTPTVSPSI